MTDQQAINSNGVLQFSRQPVTTLPIETVDPAHAVFDLAAVGSHLLNLNLPVNIIRQQGKIGILNTEARAPAPENQTGSQLLISVPPMPIENLGDAGFKKTYGVRCAYYAGAMANGIASTDMEIALGKAGLLASFGSAGMLASQIEDAVRQVQTALPHGPYAFNLLHSPNEESLERNAVEVYLKLGVKVVEAAAYIDLTPSLVYYRAAGLSLSPNGEIHIDNRIIAKVSRREVAAKFMQPAPENLLSQLVAEGHITQQQAELASRVPV
ncbi:MAG: hypothetical protein U1B80_06565, partial [Anaerolineaceae bacterium]|nr:hypothetical protein [Anaerolineaceae bacterium]